jgi:type II secretory pathway pseudopilin PulG
MLLNKKLKKLPRIMGGGGVIFFKCNYSPTTSSGDRSAVNAIKYGIKNNKNNKYSAFSLIELSIVLIIMGLLVAGITGGASLIDNARLTSLKREVDDHIRDVFTFYARVGRLPGDLDNTGRIGYQGGSVSTANSYAEPYNIAGITVTSGPFVELYLYGVSSFKPTTTDTILKMPFSTTNVRDIANGGGIPFSKVYKDFMYTHRYEVTDIASPFFTCGMHTKTSMAIFTTEVRNTENKKTIDIARKIDTKFDDGVYNGGSIRGFCRNGVDDTDSGRLAYNATNTKLCSEVVFYFDVK